MSEQASKLRAFAISVETIVRLLPQFAARKAITRGEADHLARQLQQGAETALDIASQMDRSASTPDDAQVHAAAAMCGLHEAARSHPVERAASERRYEPIPEHLYLKGSDMPLTNRDLARYATQIARRASSWAHDTMTMGDEYWDRPTINNSAERFCKDIEDIVECMLIRFEHTGPIG